MINKRNVAVLMCSLMTIILVSAPFGNSYAQEGELTEEEIQLVGRAISAYERPHDFERADITYKGLDRSEVSANFGESSFAQTSVKEIDFTGDMVLEGDSYRAQGTTSVRYIETEDDSTLQAYNFDAESFYNSGIFVITPVYTNLIGNAVELEGPISIMSDADVPTELGELSFEDLMDFFVVESSDETDTTEEPSNEFGNVDDFDLETFIGAVTSVTSTPVTFDDETTGQRIDIIMTGDELDALLEDTFSSDGDSDDPLDQMASLGAVETTIKLSVSIDDDSTMRYSYFEFAINIQDFDMNTIDETIPAGTTFSMSISVADEFTLSNITR